MTRKLPITARQLTAICRGAGKAGYIPEIILEGVVVRLVPETSLPREEFAEPETAPVRWPGPVLNHREAQVLRKLVAAVDHTLPADTIPHAGPVTVNALIKYGLVAIEGDAGVFKRWQNIRATADGITFFSRYEAHRRDNFSL